MIIQLIMSIIVVVLAQLVLDFIADQIMVRKIKKNLVINTHARAKKSNWRVGR